jgi:hypothetical protein
MNLRNWGYKLLCEVLFTFSFLQMARRDLACFFSSIIPIYTVDGLFISVEGLYDWSFIFFLAA